MHRKRESQQSPWPKGNLASDHSLSLFQTNKSFFIPHVSSAVSPNGDPTLRLNSKCGDIPATRASLHRSGRAPAGCGANLIPCRSRALLSDLARVVPARRAQVLVWATPCLLCSDLWPPAAGSMRAIIAGLPLSRAAWGWTGKCLPHHPSLTGSFRARSKRFLRESQGNSASGPHGNSSNALPWLRVPGNLLPFSPGHRLPGHGLTFQNKPPACMCLQTLFEKDRAKT